MSPNHAFFAPCRSSYLELRPPSDLAVSDGDFGTNRDFGNVVSLVGAAYTAFYFPSRTLGLCLQRAKTLPSHKHMFFPASEIKERCHRDMFLGGELWIDADLVDDSTKG